MNNYNDANLKAIGKKGEEFACKILQEDGFYIEKLNYCVKGGEIDIIAIDNDEIAFIEVKTRTENAMISGLDAVNKTKQKRIITAAKKYIDKFNPEYYPRFDIFEVVIYINDDFIVKSYELYKGAFWE